MNTKKEMKGQILIILALAMVAVLAVTAVAVDGSMVYNDRRLDQSTADSAALAGAGAAAQILKDHPPAAFTCGGGLGTSATTAAIQAARDSAMQDNVDLAVQDISNGNGVQVSCGIDALNAKYLDIKVVVTTETPTTFARMISRDSLTTTVQSTARVYPQQPFAYGNALVSLSKLCGNKVGGITFGGNSDVRVEYAGIFSNSCMKATSSSAKVRVTGGEVNYMTTCSGCSAADIEPEPQPGDQALPEKLLDPPTCTNAAYQAVLTKGTANPGNYLGINVKSGETLTLNPGLYCIKGDLTNNSKSSLIGNRVTLYFTGKAATVKINQNEEGRVDLTAPDCEEADASCGVPPAVRGLLMYFDDNYTSDVTINGGSTNNFEGTIYGPKSIFWINGGAVTDTFKAQVVGYFIELTGGAKLTMNLNGAELMQKPSSIELYK